MLMHTMFVSLCIRVQEDRGGGQSGFDPKKRYRPGPYYTWSLRGHLLQHCLGLELSKISLCKPAEASATSIPCAVQCKGHWCVDALVDQVRHQ